MNELNKEEIPAEFLQPPTPGKTVALGVTKSAHALALMQALVIASQPSMKTSVQRFNGTPRIDEVADFRRPDIKAWNARIEERNIAKGEAAMMAVGVAFLIIAVVLMFFAEHNDPGYASDGWDMVCAVALTVGAAGLFFCACSLIVFLWHVMP